MQALRKRGTIVAGISGLGAAAALGIVLASSPAQAEDPTPSPSSSTAAKPDPGAGKAQRQDELAGALATELGIDKAKVAAALEKVRAAQETKAKADRAAQLKTRLDAAVKDGKLTQEQADAILKAGEAGVLQGGPGGLGGPGGFGGPGGHGPRGGR